MKRRRIAGVGMCLGVALAGVSLSACVVTVPGDGKGQAPALRGTVFPADFKFGMTRPIDLTLNANETLFHGRAQAALEVRSADGSLVFKGPMTAKRPLNVHLVVPAKDHSVEVTFRNRDVEQKSLVALVANSATHTFQ